MGCMRFPNFKGLVPKSRTSTAYPNSYVFYAFSGFGDQICLFFYSFYIVYFKLEKTRMRTVGIADENQFVLFVGMFSRSSGKGSAGFPVVFVFFVSFYFEDGKILEIFFLNLLLPLLFM